MDTWPYRTRNFIPFIEKYIKKGSRLYIEGKIRTNSWVDKNSQEKRYSVEIFADNIVFLDRLSDDNRRSQEKDSSDTRAKIDEIIKQNVNTAGVADADDLPF